MSGEKPARGRLAGCALRGHGSVPGAALWATLTGSLLWPAIPTALSTTLARLTLEEMSARAAAVVRARCISVAVRADARGLWTLTTFERVETWKGSLPGHIVVRLPGGEAAGMREKVEGAPRFAPGEEAVLFLEPLPGGEWTIVGWVQGAYRIFRNPVSGVEQAAPDAAGALLLQRASGPYQPFAQRAIPLAELRAQVTRLSQRGGR